MALFKCKMCGGTLEINNNESVATCEYCGTKQTLPKLDDDRRANLYDRANHFRRNNEFDSVLNFLAISQTLFTCLARCFFDSLTTILLNTTLIIPSST